MFNNILTYTFISLVLLTASVQAQLKEGEHLPGLCLGFWVHGSSPTLGLNYDYQMKQAGIGTFSIGGILRYWTYSSKYDVDQWDYKYLMFGFQANYNFNKIGNGTFVPYGGLVLGYNNVSTKYTRFYNQSDSTSIIRKHDAGYESALQLWAQAGFRYFFTSKLAGTFRLGLGNLDFSEIELGVDYKF